MVVISVNVGQPEALAWDGESVTSSISKRPVRGPCMLTQTGFRGDTQTDRRVHGGPDKAVCVYSHDHYAYWREALDRELEPGMFGENLTVSSLSETEICIGDVFDLGEARVQVTEPRQPCHKLAKKFQLKDIIPRAIEKGYTGFYFRVLREGHVKAGDALTYVEGEPVRCSVDLANRIIWSNVHGTEGLEARVRQMQQVKALPERWAEYLERKLQQA